jgi:hypothetical protein
MPLPDAPVRLGPARGRACYWLDRREHRARTPGRPRSEPTARQPHRPRRPARHLCSHPVGLDHRADVVCASQLLGELERRPGRIEASQPPVGLREERLCGRSRRALTEARENRVAALQRLERGTGVAQPQLEELRRKLGPTHPLRSHPTHDLHHRPRPQQQLGRHSGTPRSHRRGSEGSAASLGFRGCRERRSPEEQPRSGCCFGERVSRNYRVHPAGLSPDLS